jgi:hypothetical protein
MLRLYDARTGQVSDITPARPGRLVLRVDTVADLRGRLLADLVRRFSERQRLRVFAYTDGPVEVLNIRPGTEETSVQVDLSVGEVSSPSVRTLEVGGTAALPGPGEVAARGLDPLALRLAVLRCHYRETLDVSWDELAEADADLAGWRARVADWSRAPGRPMSAGYVAEAEAALCDDLDLPQVLRILDQLAADPVVPAGAKFQSFAHLDLFLALDLVRDIGN